MSNSESWNTYGATLIQLAADAILVVLAVALALRMNGELPQVSVRTLGPALVFAALMVVTQSAFGLYRRDRTMGLLQYALLLLPAMVIVTPLAYMIAELVPGGRGFRESFGVAALFAFCALVLLRPLVITPFLSFLLPHRVLVLGTGPEARMVEASLVSTGGTAIDFVGFFPLEKVDQNLVSSKRLLPQGLSLYEAVRAHRISEIIVAVREQRGGVLPLRALLDCRLSGVRVTDLARFFERAHGRIPIDALKASWLIYGSGFRQGWLRTYVKRAFDIAAALVLFVSMLPVMIVAAAMIALETGRPVIYRQVRVGLRGQTFELLKFRSMRTDAEKDGVAAWASVGDGRVTAVGRFLRRTRIDELPQLVNVLRGEMSFVGPRPERPVFVEMLTGQIPFYAVRHSVKPGLTGWAQVRYSYGGDVGQSMKKLEYDLYYVKNHTLFLDILVLLETVRVVLFGEGAR